VEGRTEVVADKANAPSEDEQPVERANLDILVGLFTRERARIAQQVDKAHRNAPIHVQN
jgi:hypothetical protein